MRGRIFRDLVASDTSTYLRWPPTKTPVSAHEILIGPTNRSETTDLPGAMRPLLGFSMGVQA